MPTANGQMVLDDYVAMLQTAGFDGFTAADLAQFVNWGYYHVARKNRWYWESTTDSFTLTPGQFAVQLWPGGTELPNFRSLDKVYITTAGKQRRLKPMDDDEFAENWLSQDLSLAQNRSNPDQYYIWDEKLYILAPPSQAVDILAHYHQRVSPLTDTIKYPTVGYTDVPITPPHLDEAIFMAAKIRCHKRAQELTLANQERSDLEEAFDDMRDDEAELMDEQPLRVSPDDSWL